MTCLERKIKRSNCGFLNWIHIFLDAENSVLCPASYIYLPFRIGENYISLGGGGVQFKITLLYTTFAFTSSSVLWNFSKKSFEIICFLLLICELYGYQKDNVSNQREHVVHLLANEQSRLGIPDATEPVCLTCFCFIFGLISVLEF